MHPPGGVCSGSGRGEARLPAVQGCLYLPAGKQGAHAENRRDAARGDQPVTVYDV